MDGRTKEVYYSEYCPKCKDKDTAEINEPCAECLEHPCVDYSHKPLNFKPQ